MAIAQEISMNEANNLQKNLNEANELYLPKSWLIDKAVLIDALGLNPDDLANFSGIRIYPGAKYEADLDTNSPPDTDSPPTGLDTLTLITVAVDANGNDMVGNVAADVTDGSKVYDYSLHCPTVCSTNSNALLSNSTIQIINK